MQTATSQTILLTIHTWCAHVHICTYMVVYYIWGVPIVASLAIVAEKQHIPHIHIYVDMHCIFLIARHQIDIAPIARKSYQDSVCPCHWQSISQSLAVDMAIVLANKQFQEGKMLYINKHIRTHTHFLFCFLLLPI